MDKAGQMDKWGFRGTVSLKDGQLAGLPRLSLLPFIIISVSYVLALTLLMEGLCTLIYRLWCFEFPR